MTLEFRLASTLVRQHPDRAAAVLERVPPADALRVLSRFNDGETAPILPRMSPLASAQVLDRLDDPRVAGIVTSLEPAVGARLMRRLSDERRGRVLARLPAPIGQAVGALLRFPEYTAGALMDPETHVVSDDLTADEAVRQIRQAADHIHYNLYVVDRQQTLVGVLNLRELLLAPTKARLADVMVPHPLRLHAHATRTAVVSHPGWKAVHSIPVVDDHGCYVGVIRYATLRSLEEELFGRKRADANAADALGGLFAAGAAGLMDAFTAADRTKTP